jgi:hypothetical protein
VSLAFLTTSISSNIKAEVGGGIVTSGLSFHGTNRAALHLGRNDVSGQTMYHHCFDIKKTCFLNFFSFFALLRFASDPITLVTMADDYVVSPSRVQIRALPVIYRNKCYTTSTLLRVRANPGFTW